MFIPLVPRIVSSVCRTSSLAPTDTLVRAFTPTTSLAPTLSPVLVCQHFVSLAWHKTMDLRFALCTAFACRRLTTTITRTPPPRLRVHTHTHTHTHIRIHICVAPPTTTAAVSPAKTAARDVQNLCAWVWDHKLRRAVSAVRCAHISLRCPLLLGSTDNLELAMYYDAPSREIVFFFPRRGCSCSLLEARVLIN
jgi:hypothetical protein